MKMKQLGGPTPTLARCSSRTARSSSMPVARPPCSQSPTPVTVGSHYHFLETNPASKFDRKKARGMRLNIAAGTACASSQANARGDAGRACRETDDLWIPGRRDGEALTQEAT